MSDADFEPLSVSMGGVVPRMEHVALTANNDARKLVHAGDYVINSRSDRKGSGGIAPTDGSVSVISTVLRPIGIVPRYAHHLLRSPAFQEEFYRWGTGIVADLWSTRYAGMSKITLPLPPEAEQRAIADFLDRETAKIDALIEKQNEMVALLRERRIRTIDDAVQGAPPARIGHWWQVIDCKHDTAEFQPEGEYPIASIGQVQGDSIDLSEAKHTSRDWFISLREGLRRPSPGDLVMSRNATVGKVAQVLESTPPFALGQDVVLLRRRRGADAAYLRYVMDTSFATDALERAMIGSTFRRINVSAIKRLRLPFPSALSQRTIAARLDRKVARIDALIAKAEEFVALARERRAALITAAVTGQIDVLREAS